MEQSVFSLRVCVRVCVPFFIEGSVQAQYVRSFPSSHVQAILEGIVHFITLKSLPIQLFMIALG
jgi:hypothetical protein